MEAAGVYLCSEAIVYATRNYHLVSYLLDHNVNIDATSDGGKTALMTSTGINAFELDMRNKTRWVNAKEPGYLQPEVATLLITRGADIQLADESGNTALMAAVYCGSVEITRLLLQAGASIDTKNRKGQTALTIALDQQNAEILDLVL